MVTVSIVTDVMFCVAELKLYTLEAQEKTKKVAVSLGVNSIVLTPKHNGEVPSSGKALQHVYFKKSDVIIQFNTI